MNNPTTMLTEQLTLSATEEVFRLIFADQQPISIVDSPPGAGKTRLVESVVTLARSQGLKAVVVVPTNEQAFDLVRRLLDNHTANKVKLELAHGRVLPDDLSSRSDRRSENVNVWGTVSGPDILIATVAKLGASIRDYSVYSPTFDLLVCDEAYQITYEDFMPLAHLARQYLLVGDPGQLRPTLDGVDLRRFETAHYKVHWPAPLELLRSRPQVPRVQLPVSRRLPPDTVEFVQPSFYPELRFVASDQDRRIGFAAAGMTGAVDSALDRLASGESLVGLILPDPEFPILGIDYEVVKLMASVVERLLHRGVEWTNCRTLQAQDIGCVDPHVVSNDALRQELASRGLPGDEIVVEVPELWQGLERPMMVAKHPLTGASRLSDFELESGRWCVSLSRHQLGCVIVGRNGISSVLETHQHDSATRAIGADDSHWSGLTAHRRIWEELSRRDRLIPV